MMKTLKYDKRGSKINYNLIMKITDKILIDRVQKYQCPTMLAVSNGSITMWCWRGGGRAWGVRYVQGEEGADSSISPLLYFNSFFSFLSTFFLFSAVFSLSLESVPLPLTRDCAGYAHLNDKTCTISAESPFSEPKSSACKVIQTSL